MICVSNLSVRQYAPADVYFAGAGSGHLAKASSFTA